MINSNSNKQRHGSRRAATSVHTALPLRIGYTDSFIRSQYNDPKQQLQIWQKRENFKEQTFMANPDSQSNINSTPGILILLILFTYSKRLNMEKP